MGTARHVVPLPAVPAVSGVVVTAPVGVLDAGSPTGGAAAAGVECTIR